MTGVYSLRTPRSNATVTAAVRSSTPSLIHLLEELTKGEPVSRKRAFEVLGVPGEKVDRMFMAIAAAGGQLDDQGNRLTVTADQVVKVVPAGAVTSVFVPGKTPTQTKDGEPVIGADSDVCVSMLFYASRESAEQALENYPNIAIFTIEQAFDLAHKTWTEHARQLRHQDA